MPINPFDPADFGFQEGSPIFEYPTDARRAINEANMRIRGPQGFARFWERVLTTAEREELGNDVNACFQIQPFSANLLGELRGWIVERAIVEIAHALNFLTPQDYTWLREVTGDPIFSEASSPMPPTQRSPRWDRQTGRLEFEGRLCRDIRVARATTLVPVLDTFQEAGWPPAVGFSNDSVDPQRIHQVVRNLNKDLVGIRFSVQDQQICWQPSSP